MKFATIFFIFLISTGSHAQSFKKYPVSNSGCSIYNYCESKFNISKSQDSSTIYTGECTFGEINYGIICVKLIAPLTDLTLAESVMIAYLDYLKQSFSIINATGYGKGHILNNNSNTRGILDYWEDKDKNKWKVKSWTDGNFIGVLFAYSLKPLPENKVNLYLDGFRFPDMK
jgi:hypothetical protein